MILKIKWSTECFLQVWNSEKLPTSALRQARTCKISKTIWWLLLKVAWILRWILRSEKISVDTVFWNLFVVNAKSPKKRAQVFLHLNLKHEETNKTATATTPTTQPTTTTTTTNNNNNNNNNKKDKDKPPGRNITKKKQKHQKKKKKKLKKKKESAAMVPHCFLLHDFFGLHPS